MISATSMCKLITFFTKFVCTGQHRFGRVLLASVTEDASRMGQADQSTSDLPSLVHHSNDIHNHCSHDCKSN